MGLLSPRGLWQSGVTLLLAVALDALLRSWCVGIIPSWVFVAALGLGAFGCARPSEPAPRPPPAAPPVALPAPEPTTLAAPEPTEVELPTEPTDPAEDPAEAIEPLTVEVPGDKSVLVVKGASPTPIVYLHGRCGNPRAFLHWAKEGRAFGTIVSLTGDTKCKSGSRTQWSSDTAAIDRRVTRALEAVEKALAVDLDLERRVVIGYSQGSLKAEALATRFPSRYPRAALIAGPRGPRDESLGKTEAVLIMVGDHDARDHLREATRKLEKRGKPVRYLELRGAHHGEYGPDAETTMRAGLSWLVATPTPLL